MSTHGWVMSRSLPALRAPTTGCNNYRWARGRAIIEENDDRSPARPMGQHPRRTCSEAKTEKLQETSVVAQETADEEETEEKTGEQQEKKSTTPTVAAQAH